MDEWTDGRTDGRTDDTRIHPHWGEEVPIRAQQERDEGKTSVSFLDIKSLPVGHWAAPPPPLARYLRPPLLSLVHPTFFFFFVWGPDRGIDQASFHLRGKRSVRSPVASVSWPSRTSRRYQRGRTRDPIRLAGLLSLNGTKHRCSRNCFLLARGHARNPLC